MRTALNWNLLHRDAFAATEGCSYFEGIIQPVKRNLQRPPKEGASRVSISSHVRARTLSTIPTHSLIPSTVYG